MMYCKYCGKEVYADAVVCIHCGRALNDCQDSIDDSGHIGWGLLGFLVPMVGLILYIIWKNDKPKNAVIAGKGALINLCVGAGVMLIGVLVAVIIYASAATATGSLLIGLL